MRPRSAQEQAAATQMPIPANKCTLWAEAQPHVPSTIQWQGRRGPGCRQGTGKLMTGIILIKTNVSTF